MEVINNIAVLRQKINDKKKQNYYVGLVPTMGALHEGHLSLIRAAKAQTDIAVVSIFVNEKQFDDKEDFKNYPRNLDQDLALLKDQGVDFVFAPSDNEMWPHGNQTFVDTLYLSNILQGFARKGHFCGVLTVVAKLFNIVAAHKAFFGEKDFQQLTLIRRMVLDLAFPIEIIGVPLLRDSDGVAASSRNQLLTKDHRRQAVVLFKALKAAEQAFKEGEKQVRSLTFLIKDILQTAPDAEIEEIAILDALSLNEIEEIKEQDAVILLSVKFGAVRLIDQITLK